MTRLLIALIALLSINTVAFGHSKMSGSTPEDGATVEAGLAAVSLTFDRKVRLTRVMLAAAPAEMTLAAVMSDVEALENQAEIGVLSELPKGFVEETEIDFDPLTPGVYKLHWIAVAQDGHTMEGKVHFAVESAD